MATFQLSSVASLNLGRSQNGVLRKGLKSRWYRSKIRLNVLRSLILVFAICNRPFSSPPLNPLPNGKILDWSKLKAFAGNKINVAKMTISLSDRVENIVGNGENAGFQHFLLLPLCFQKPSFSGLLKVGIVW